MQVRIVTCCPEEAALYANLLIFRSLRIGFPTARVIVTDNGSRPWARVRIMEAVHRCGAEMRVAGPMFHGELIARLLGDLPDGEPAVFMDPDICFWEKVENWRFPETTLLAGRLIPTHRCDVEQCVIHRRLHSSFLWMPDPRRLRLTLPGVTEEATWRQFKWNVGAEKHLWDTGARPYADLPPECVHAFDEAQLDCYEHLFAGTEAARFLPRIGEDFRPLFEQLHEAARQPDLPASMRGAWKIQDRYFAARRVNLIPS